MSSSICDENLSKITNLLGGGEFSKVFEHSKGIVIKAYLKKNDCKTAGGEFALQKKIFDLFNFDHQYTKKLEISEPKQFCPMRESKKYTIGDKQYDCFVVMTTLRAIPMKIWKNVVPKQAFNQEKFDPNFYNKIKDKPEYGMMGHTAFNNKWSSGFYDTSWFGKISATQGPRGYFFEDKDYQNGRALDKLMKEYKLDMSLTYLQETMGFIYGYMLYKGHLIGHDVEFALGYYNGRGWRLNVLDFGLVHNVEESVGESTAYDRASKKWLESKEQDWADLEKETAKMMGDQWYAALYEETTKATRVPDLDENGKQKVDGKKRKLWKIKRVPDKKGSKVVTKGWKAAKEFALKKSAKSKRKQNDDSPKPLSKSQSGCFCPPTIEFELDEKDDKKEQAKNSKKTSEKEIVVHTKQVNKNNDPQIWDMYQYEVRIINEEKVLQICNMWSSRTTLVPFSTILKKIPNIEQAKWCASYLSQIGLSVTGVSAHVAHDNNLLNNLDDYSNYFDFDDDAYHTFVGYNDNGYKTYNEHYYKYPNYLPFGSLIAMLEIDLVLLLLIFVFCISVLCGITGFILAKLIGKSAKSQENMLVAP